MQVLVKFDVSVWCLNTNDTDDDVMCSVTTLDGSL
jgi:hypothetical protein